MAANTIQESDPSAITTIEVVRSLFKFCGDQIGENIKYCQEQIDKNNKEERELTNAKIIKVAVSTKTHKTKKQKHVQTPEQSRK